MTIISEDQKKVLDVGNYEMWMCFYSTIISNLNHIADECSLAVNFLKKGKCESSDCMETARQLNIIKDGLSRLSIDKIVYDYTDTKKKAPWINKISYIVTSCGSFFTTAEGRDLISEINVVLCYAAIRKISVSVL